MISRFIVDLSQSRFSLCEFSLLSYSEISFRLFITFHRKTRLVLFGNFLLSILTKLSILEFQIFKDFCPKFANVFLSHGNFHQHIFAVKRHSIHWKSFPFQTKIDLVLKESEEVKNFLGRENRFSDVLVIISLSFFPKEKFVVGRDASWVFRGFLHFLHSPTTAALVHCAVDAADSRAG